MPRLIVIATALGILGASVPITVFPQQSDARFIELLFTASASECDAARVGFQKQIPQGAGDGNHIECFVTVHSPMDHAGAPSLPPYVLEVSGDRLPMSPLRGKAALRYRAIGPLHVAKNEQGSNQTPAGTGPVKTYRMLVFSQPTAGNEVPYNDWYEHEHVSDVLRVSGFISGRRFERIAGSEDMMSLPPFLVEFELRSADLAATGSEIGARIRDGRTRMSPSFDGKRAIGLMISAIDDTDQPR
jgi:hypothetical protein